jgi:hypothetical protein
VTARGSGDSGRNGPEVWLWIGLVLGGLVVALALQKTPAAQPSSPAAPAGAGSTVRADRALFCAVSMLIGVVGLFAFLFHIHYLTQSWHYIEMLCLCALSLDGLCGAGFPALRPWGWLRIGFLMLMLCWCARPAWQEAHTRRTNVDLIAATLEKTASEQDLIVVQDCWEAISFDRYYRGRTPWMSVPPIDSHKVHRNDLVFARMNQPDAMASVLTGITNTLRSGHAVWVVGQMIDLPPEPPPINQPVKWVGTYFIYWNEQLSSFLSQHARQNQAVEMPVDVPIARFENLPLFRFSGYTPGTNDLTKQK